MRKAIVVAVAGLMVLSAALIAVGAEGGVTQCEKNVKKTSACAKSAAVKDVKKCGTTASAHAEGAMCSGTCSGSCCAPAAKAACANKKRAAHSAALEKLVDRVPYRESKRVVVTGKVVCGKCVLKKLDACQPMVETSDGKLYPLAKSAMVSKMKMEKAENGYEINSRVKQISGVRYLDVQSYTTL